ncbi:hypothetical protein E0Z10_g5519 [Xylaria hypoxylon]|uniref:Chitin-binding type-1 domain-containing protein n=1 Tax=Xylaria hypoxylon TaxID=37992 RepID=A0A4Z0YVP3_9PEZI|nr:hypothetical protein E0Z10_g5519 [Xylaria hypoxylon]
MALLTIIDCPLRYLPPFLLAPLLSNVLGLPQPGTQGVKAALGTCANLPSPVEVYLDTAVKVREDAGRSEVAGPTRAKRQAPAVASTESAVTVRRTAAPCGDFAATPNATCPINVYCFQYGFYGVTDEFCQKGCQSNCEQPTSSGKSGGDVQSRIIGYYEGWSFNAIDVQANLDVKADINAKIDTQFGLTIITTSTTGSVLPDLSQSFMYLRNRGDIAAVFTIDAIIKASYDTRDRELFGLQNFNALFSVPGIITIASWDTRVSFPDQGSGYNPKSLKDPETSTQPGNPTFDWSVEAQGQITAHVKPLVSFGITWGLPTNPWIFGEWSAPIIPETCPISASRRDAEPLLIEPLSQPARLGARRGGLPSDSLSTELGHGLRTRASTVIGPLLHLPFGLTCPTAEKETGHVPACPLCSDGSGITKRNASSSSAIFARGDGPSCIYIPGSDGEPCPARIQSRDLVEVVENATFGALLAGRGIEKRKRKKSLYKTSTGISFHLDSSTYPNCGEVLKYAGRYAEVSRFYGYDANQQNPPCVLTIFMNNSLEMYFDQGDYVVEHVFEFQTLIQFILWLAGQRAGAATPAGYTKPTKQWVEIYLLAFNPQGGDYYSFQSARLGPANIH